MKRESEGGRGMDGERKVQSIQSIDLRRQLDCIFIFAMIKLTLHHIMKLLHGMWNFKCLHKKYKIEYYFKISLKEKCIFKCGSHFFRNYISRVIL